MTIRFFGYILELRLSALWPWTHFKIHKRSYGTHIVWGRLSAMFGPVGQCEICNVETEFEDICQGCYEHNFCECGVRLEDAYGSPGDGLCRRCD